MAYYGFNERLQQMDSSHMDDRRRGGRIRCLDLRCSLGKVLDLSSTGMRVLAKKIRQGQPVLIHLADEHGEIMLRAEAMWIKPRALRAKEVGLRFLDMEPQLRHRIAGMARNATNQLTLDPTMFDEKPKRKRR